MKTYEIVTRVEDDDEGKLIRCASDLVGRVVRREIHHKDGDPTNNDLENLEVRGVPPCFPPEVAQAHAAELRQVLADLLEWRARLNPGEPRHPEWREAKALMERIRDEEDAAREGRKQQHEEKTP